MSPVQSYPPMHPPYRSPREPPANLPVSLPPLRLPMTSPTPSARNANSIGVHSMLNPPNDMAQQPYQGPRRSLLRMQSSSPVETQHSQSLPSISRPNSVDSVLSCRQDQNAKRPFAPPERPTMRPLLHDKGSKTHIVNTLKPPTGTIDAHQSPFLTASTRPSEIATPQHSALPTPPAAGRTHYFLPTALTPPPTMGSRVDLHRPGVNFPQSGSASPITQYSPYSQSASVASTQYDSHPAQAHYGPGSLPMHDIRQGPSSIDGDPTSMIAMAPSSQSSIQLMTIKSQHGPPRQIPVETQTASKGADEKRRRNAGASARFRARRKEKEREASMSISRLQQSVRDATEDATFYREERDYWRCLALQSHPERSHARPHSPRLRRVSTDPSRAPSCTTAHGSEASFDGYEEESRDEEQRNVRRRTNHYNPALGPHQIDAPSAGHDARPYAPQTYPPATAHSPTQNAQVHQSSQQQLPPGPPSGLQHPSPERPMYHDAFPAETGHYEHRAWTSEHTKSAPH